MVDEAFDRFDTDKDGKLDFFEYQEWLKENPSAISFVDTIKQFATIQLGVNPTNSVEELGFVLPILKTSRKREAAIS
jgi:hypothetical protein